MMRRIITTGILALLSLISFGQEVKHYHLEVGMNVKERSVEVKGVIDIDFQNQDSIELVLWKNTRIETIRCNDKDIIYTFDTISKSPSQYIPGGSSLILKNQGKEKGSEKIYFSYLCNMTDMNIWGNQFTDDWIELGIYSAWYPVHLQSQEFTSEYLVNIDENYIVNGSGFVTGKKGHYRISTDWNVFDNVIIASESLQKKSYFNNNLSVDILFLDFPDSDVDSLTYRISDVLDFYTKLFGSSDHDNYVKFVLSPRNRGGYSRPRYISYTANKNDWELLGGIAHETAHFWWNKANTGTWEDWLNESFASYSYIAYVRENIGKKKYNEIISEYRNRTKDAPPVWGLQRNSKEASNVLYRKGALILTDFEDQLGNIAFQKLIRSIALNNISTTEELLNLVEIELSVSERNWLENRLKE